MTKDELKAKLASLEKEYELNQRGIYREYALANNPHKIGDIIKDHIKTLVIEKIKVYISFGESECVYYGIILTSAGKPSKNQDQCIYQSNIIAK